MAKKMKIAALWGMHEVTFGTDPDTDGSDYKFMKIAGEASFLPQAEVQPRPGLTNALVQQDHVVGAKGGTLSFALEMKASGTPAVSATAAIASESSPILEGYFGSVTRGTGTTAAALSGDGSSGTPMKVSSAAGLAKYMMISVNGEVRFITGISGTDVTLNKALSAAPANGDVVTASSLFKRSDTGQKSFAFCGKRDGIEYTFLGCKISSLRIEGLSSRGLALLQVEVDVGTWSETTKASLPSTILSGITAVKGPVVKGATCTINGVEEVVAEATLDPGIQTEFIDSINGTEGKSGICSVESNPTGALHPYYASGRFTTFLAGTAVEIALAVGTSSNGFGFIVPRAQYGNPDEEDRNGMVGTNLPFMARNNGADADLVVCQF